jgi:cell fate (sporulation/competence/biofilm development) regulator YlbF (YheA/YmcA/DUF963 family)
VTTLETRLTPELQTAIDSLGQNLLASEPFVAYDQAQARFKADAHAQALLERLSVAQADMRRRQANGGVTQAGIDQLRALQREVQSSRAIMDYAAAQQTAVTYLREINRAISEMLGVDFASLAKRPGCC